MIKAVLFDLDGTLLDRDASLLAFANAQYERLTQWLGHIPKERYIERFIELDERGYVWKDKVYEQLIAEFQIQGIGWETLLQDYVTEFKNYCVPFPGLLAMLNELKRRSIRMGIITNGKGQFQLDNIKALKIESYFEAILISERENMRKPDARLFLRALDCLEVAPAESVFIGDHPENDVKAARQAGMWGVWKKDWQWDEVEADGEIDSLMEVLKWMEAIENPSFLQGSNSIDK